MINDLKLWFSKLFWTTCKYCNSKKPYYYYIFEINIDKKDFIDGTIEICTDCTVKLHKK